jgi:hypothetical protein
LDHIEYPFSLDVHQAKTNQRDQDDVRAGFMVKRIHDQITKHPSEDGRCNAYEYREKRMPSRDRASHFLYKVCWQPGPATLNPKIKVSSKPF